MTALTFKFVALAHEGKLRIKVISHHAQDSSHIASDAYLGTLEMTPFEWARFRAALAIGCDRLGTEFGIDTSAMEAQVRLAEEYTRVEKG